MSRKYRLEEEKAKLLNTELQEEEDKIKLQRERIFGPIVWKRLAYGIRIQDLQSMYFEPLLDIIEEHYIPENVIFRNTRFLEDEKSVKSYNEKLIHSMKDRSSIIAIDEENDEIAGVLILKAVKKCDYGRVFSRIMLSDGLVYQSVKEFMNYITRKVDIYEHFQCEIFLRYYLLCITPPYRGKGLGYHMMQTGVDIARHLNIPVIVGLMTNWKLQKLARKLGMETVFEIEYKTWHDKTGYPCDATATIYFLSYIITNSPRSVPKETLHGGLGIPYSRDYIIQQAQQRYGQAELHCNPLLREWADDIVEITLKHSRPRLGLNKN